MLSPLQAKVGQTGSKSSSGRVTPGGSTSSSVRKIVATERNTSASRGYPTTPVAEGRSVEELGFQKGLVCQLSNMLVKIFLMEK